MNRRWVLLVIAVNLIGLTALVFIYPNLIVGPGPLVPAHAALETNCFACHAPMRGASADQCITCHKVADIGLRSTTGTAIARTTPMAAFHQALTSQNCMACHTDHAKTALTPRFRSKFSHALLNPATRQTCTSCHTAPETAVHKDATSQCSQCHSQDRWKPATFDHTPFFALDGDHNAACTTCHTTNDRRQYTCFGCHEHTQANIRTKHVREGIPNFASCVSCHRSAHGERTGGGKRERKDDD